MRECLAGGTLQYIGGGTYNGDDDYCPTYSLIKKLEGKKNGTTINIAVTSSYDNDQCVKREDVDFNATLSCISYTYDERKLYDDPSGGTGRSYPCNDTIPHELDGNARVYKWVSNINYKWPSELSSVSPQSITLTIYQTNYISDTITNSCKTTSNTLTYNIGTKKSDIINYSKDLGGNGLLTLLNGMSNGGNRITSVFISKGAGPYKVGCINYNLRTDPVILK